MKFGKDPSAKSLYVFRDTDETFFQIVTRGHKICIHVKPPNGNHCHQEIERSARAPLFLKGILANVKKEAALRPSFRELVSKKAQTFRRNFDFFAYRCHEKYIDIFF